VDAQAKTIEMKEIQPELRKHIRNCARKFKDTVQKMLFWQARVEKTLEDIATMQVVDADGANPCKYPAGTRPFTSPQ
jgi:hypothetical protein